MATVLIVDDEKDLLNALADTLVSENFGVLKAMTGMEALKVATEQKPDCILLDLRLPDIDGYDVCRKLKEQPETKRIPIIMVSTRSRDTEKIVGLEIGADDYVTKPYNILELLARLRVALRRITNPASAEASVGKAIEWGALKVTPDLRKVEINGITIKLTRKEFDLLVFLISKPGKPFSRHTLMSSLWGESYDSLHGTVDSHIRTLRKKLGPCAPFIETVPGIGYRWTENSPLS